MELMELWRAPCAEDCWRLLETAADSWRLLETGPANLPILVDRQAISKQGKRHAAGLAMATVTLWPFVVRL